MSNDAHERQTALPLAYMPVIAQHSRSGSNVAAVHAAQVIHAPQHQQHPAAGSRISMLKPGQVILHYATANRAVSGLQAHLKVSADAEQWTIEALKRHANGLKDNSSELRRISAKTLDKQHQAAHGFGQQDAIGTLGCLRHLYQNTQDSASDSLALEAFLRNHILARLERDAKARNERLKKRLKTVHDMLSRLDLIEKVYVRAHADLSDEQKKLSNLEDRRALELAEEVDKVETDLKRCVSQVQYKAADDEVAAHKLNEMSIYWSSEWETFRAFARQIDLERATSIRVSLIEHAQAGLIVRGAALARERQRLHVLESHDVPSEVLNTLFYTGLGPSEEVAEQPASVDAIAAVLKSEQTGPSAPNSKIPAAEQLTNFITQTLRKRSQQPSQETIPVIDIRNHARQASTSLQPPTDGSITRKTSLKRKPVPLTTASEPPGVDEHGMLQPISPSCLAQTSIQTSSAYPSSAPPQPIAFKPLPILPQSDRRGAVYLDVGPESQTQSRSAPPTSTFEKPDGLVYTEDAEDEMAYGGVMSIYGGVAPSTIHSFEALDRDFDDVPEMPTSVSVSTMLGQLDLPEDRDRASRQTSCDGSVAMSLTCTTPATPMTANSLEGQCGYESGAQNRDSIASLSQLWSSGQRISLASTGDLPTSDSASSLATIHANSPITSTLPVSSGKRVSKRVSLVRTSPRKASLPPHLRAPSSEGVPLSTSFPDPTSISCDRSAVVTCAAGRPQVSPQPCTSKEEQDLPPLPDMNSDGPPTLALPRISTFQIDDSWSDSLLSTEERAQQRLAEHSRHEPMPVRL